MLLTRSRTSPPPRPSRSRRRPRRSVDWWRRVPARQRPSATLAARLREHRAREEELWRAAVKPSLVKEGKGRFRGHAKPQPTAPRSGLAGEAGAERLARLGLLAHRPHRDRCGQHVGLGAGPPGGRTPRLGLVPGSRLHARSVASERVTRGRTAKVLTQRWDGAGARTVVPTSSSSRSRSRCTSTATSWPPPCARPGHDFELAVGLCHGDGLLGGATVLSLPLLRAPAARWTRRSTS